MAKSKPTRQAKALANVKKRLKKLQLDIRAVNKMLSRGPFCMTPVFGPRFGAKLRAKRGKRA